MAEQHLTLSAKDVIKLTPLQKKEPASARTKPAEFVQLPYMQSLELAGRSQNALLAVLIELAHQSFKEHENTVALTNRALRSAGIRARAKLRALRQLEKAGLIAVSWHGKRSPRVTILWK